MRRLVRNLLLVAFVLVVLGALLYRSRRAFAHQGFNWTVLVSSVRETRLSLVLLAVATVFVCYGIRALRWKSFSRYIGQPTFWNVYAATLMGFAAIFLLGRVGEPVRPLLIARKDRLPVSGTFGVYVLERIFDSACTVALFGLSLLLLPSDIWEGAGDEDTVTAVRTTGIMLLAGLLLLVAFLVYFRVHGAGLLERRLASWHASKGWRKRVADAFTGFSEGLQAIRGPRDLIEGMIYSVVHWLLIVLVFFWILKGFGGDLASLGIAGAMLVLAITMLGALVQLPAVGGGAQAATFFALTGFFGIEKEPAAAAAILIWLITFAASCLVGVPLMIREGWSMRELWQLASRKKQAEVIAAHRGRRGGARGSSEEVSR